MDLKILSFNKTLFKKEFNTVKLLILFIAGLVFATTTIELISQGNTLNRWQENYEEHGIEYDKEQVIENIKERSEWILTSFHLMGLIL